MAINGHTTSKEVTRYTRVARQKVRAESALKRLTREQNQDKSAPFFAFSASGGTRFISKYLEYFHCFLGVVPRGEVSEVLPVDAGSIPFGM